SRAALVNQPSPSILGGYLRRLATLGVTGIGEFSKLLREERLKQQQRQPQPQQAGRPQLLPRAVRRHRASQAKRNASRARHKRDTRKQIEMLFRHRRRFKGWSREYIEMLYSYPPEQFV